MKDFFFVMVVLLQLYIGFLVSRGKLKKDDSNIQFPLNLTFLGASLVISFIVCFGLTISLYFIDKDEQDKFKVTLRSADSTQAANYADKLDTNNMHIMKLLADHDLYLDRQNDSIKQKLSDSALEKHEAFLQVYNGIDGQLTINNDSVTCSLMISNNSDGDACDINISVTPIFESLNQYHIGTEDKILNNQKMVAHTSHTQFANLSNASTIDTLFELYQGAYLSCYRNKRIPFFTVVFLVLKEKVWYGTNYLKNPSLLAFLKSNKFIR